MSAKQWSWTGGRILKGDECADDKTADAYGDLFAQFGRDYFLTGQHKKNSRLIIKTYAGKTNYITGAPSRRIFLEAKPITIVEEEP